MNDYVLALQLDELESAFLFCVTAAGICFVFAVMAWAADSFGPRYWPDDPAMPGKPGDGDPYDESKEDE